MEIAVYPRRISSSHKGSSFKIYTIKNPKPPFSLSLSSPVFRVSAHFSRQTGRRKNHLRKKLIEQQQVRLTPQNPIHTQTNTNQLDTNPDAEFWDNGSDPISTSFQDSDGKVDVNKDVIFPSPSAYKNLNLLAKSHIEMGKYHLQTFMGKHISGKPANLSRVVGALVVVCGFLVVVAFKNYFTKEKGDGVELTSLEKEMLRRKAKARSRMAKERSVKAGSVEVIQDFKGAGVEHEVMVFKERPQLDKEEVMNSIVKVKAFDNDGTDMGKIQEIRAMAKRAREMARNGESMDNEPGEKEVNPASFDMESSSDVLRLDVPNINGGVVPEMEGKELKLLDVEKVAEKKSVGVKLGIISSVKEAREYLHKKERKQEPEISNLSEPPTMASNDDVFGDKTSRSDQSWKDTSLGGNGNALINDTNSKDECLKSSDGELGRAKREKWIEDNFHEFEPLIEKIRGGFRNNYMAAREKVKEDMNLVTELERDEIESEFEWMKDEKLREIVFQVRENELMGRDPFYLMDAQDRDLFFKGLEKKVEKENEKLAHLHQYLHSNIENLDYGADGISLYDSPEKIIPRWKGPPPPTTMSQEFLDDYLDQRKALFAETLGNLNLDPQNMLQRSNEKIESTNLKSTKPVIEGSDDKIESKNLKSSKTVIEGSDGSIKPGKKSGKEFWQHTKKWSRGFIDSYNAENDPEIKATMKDIGKDLDRWITEKEIQEAADIMDKVPDKGKKFITERINKLKREMELFGPQAVVSKYSEYADEEEIDYYWWLDLPFLLCIEMYIDGDGDQRIGFYSLEMAPDLELDPKPHHIIAFEDAGDCKNFCYIIQTHMEMLGNGNAFVVPQLPKDTYREAKANGFNVTVVRKGELKMDVDQTLEEVEEKIVEIGSKMYHDEIMKSRNVNVDAVMKGVFGVKRSTKRRRLKRPTK